MIARRLKHHDKAVAGKKRLKDAQEESYPETKLIERLKEKLKGNADGNKVICRSRRSLTVWWSSSTDPPEMSCAERFPPRGPLASTRCDRVARLAQCRAASGYNLGALIQLFFNGKRAEQWPAIRIGRTLDQEREIRQKEGKLFGKLSRAIIVAAQHGGGDPSGNLALRSAIDKARKASMPRDNIDRAIKRDRGGLAPVVMPKLSTKVRAGFAVLCDILNHNRNRMAGEIRKASRSMTAAWGVPAESPGCLAGDFFFPPATSTRIRSSRSPFKRRKTSLTFGRGVRGHLRSGGLSKSAVSEKPNSRRTSPRSNAFSPYRRPRRRHESPHFQASSELFEDQDHVQSVTANYNIPDEIMEEATSGT